MRLNPFRRGGEKSLTNVPVKVDPVIIELLRAFDGSAQSLGNIYTKLAPVRTVVDFLAEAVSTTSLKVYRRTTTGRPEARSHPLAELLRAPNPEMTTRDLLFGTVADLGIYGNAYWWKVARGSQRWLIPLPPRLVTPKGGDVLIPGRYEVWFDGKSSATVIQAEDMAHFKLYNPEDRRYGLSKLFAVKNVLDEEIAASANREGFWKNAARREGVIRRPAESPEWSDEARNRFRADWQARTAGSKNAGVTPILEDGMEWVADSFSPKDSEFVEGRKFVLEATARVFNVPPQLFGLTGTATFASQREFSKWVYKGSLPPWYELIQSEIDLQVLPWVDPRADGDIYTEFNVESKLRGDFQEQADIVSKAVGRPWMEVAEARQLFNLPDRGDPDDHELAVPTNNVSLGGMEPPAALPPAPTSQVEQVGKFLARQARSVASKSGAAGEFVFDADRWHRELADIVGDEVARQINEQTRERLARQLTS